MEIIKSRRSLNEHLEEKARSLKINSENQLLIFFRPVVNRFLKKRNQDFVFEHAKQYITHAGCKTKLQFEVLH